ncbi:MAG: hypothetical protein LC797_07955, partial [Chloroflexi bacterium]|nr:hypothetical protein [Chloroflexota bacterium]
MPFCETITSAGSTLYAGCRNGLYRSDDRGATWRQLLAGGRVLTLAVSSELLLVGTEEDGVLRSEDGGRTFSAGNAGLRDLTIQALALPPDFEHDGTGFAGTPTG